MNRVLLAIILLVLGMACTEKSEDITENIILMQNRGDFARAESLITQYLEEHKNLDEESVRQLHFEIERGRRIMNDYRLTEDKLIAGLQNQLHDFNIEEFAKWEKEGRFDILWIDDQKRYVNPSISNLFFRYPEMRTRKKNFNTYSTTARLTLDQARNLKKLSMQNPDPVRLPRDCRVKQTLTIKSGRVPGGENVRCWLPYPPVFQTQSGVKYLHASHKPKWLAYPESNIRSVYMEGQMPDSGSLVFSIEYLYTAYAYYQEIDSALVQTFSGDEPVYKEYTREEVPHEIFSEELRGLASRITGTEKNPYLKARKIYNWIADSIKYSYAREYSTLRNISAYCYENRYGDCGQEAILFITLCRITGIPARWQSGFFAFPQDEGMHDWTEIYIKPYGWLPVDTYMGIFFTSITEDLTDTERKEMRDFYFGNIDHYRLVANKGHNLDLYPPKKHFRSETVDFQRGEVEWKSENLYFTDWRWNIEVTDVD